MPEMETINFDEIQITRGGQLAFEAVPSGKPITITSNYLRGDLTGALHIRENQVADLAGIDSTITSNIWTYIGSDTTLPNDVILTGIF